MLKQKQPRVPHWQGIDVLSRKPWPSAQRINTQKSPFHFRPPEPPAWREPNPYSYQAPLYNYNNPKRDHYFLTPYYRNAMPPPPNPNRLLMIDPRRRFVKQNEDSCYCRSRSMEDVRADVLTPDWESDVNGNRVPLPMRKDFNKYSNRRSMDNLLVDTNFSPPSKRAGRLQVKFLFLW